MQKRYKTIVLSDIHLGSKWSRTKEVTKFLKKITKPVGYIHKHSTESFSR